MIHLMVQGRIRMLETNPLVWYDSMTEEFATAQFGFPYVWHEIQKHVDNDGCEWGSCKPGNRWEWERLTRPASDGWADPGADPVADWNKPEADPTNPDYYKFPNGAETIDITEWLSGCGAQAVQYIVRATRTDGKVKGDPIEDLTKALWFVRREIDRLTAQS